MIEIRIQDRPFDPATEQETLWRGRPQVGALVSFLGLMRDFNEGQGVTRMILEHYPGMTEKALLGNRKRGRPPLGTGWGAHPAPDWCGHA